MPLRHHLGDAIHCRIMGKLEERRKIKMFLVNLTSHAVFFIDYDPHSKKVEYVLGARQEVVLVHIPKYDEAQEGRDIVISAKRKRRSTAAQLANKLCAASGIKISRKTIA